MSADKRKVSTDALETLGTIIGENEKRDAIHLAVLPAVADERLYPGQPITLDKDGRAVADPLGLGIVDPFLSRPAFPDERFWMVLKPRIITSLRHVWSHPAFEDEEGTLATPATSSGVGLAIDIRKAELTLDRYADDARISRAEMIAAARDYKEHGSWFTLDHSNFDGVDEEFWSAYDVVTGETTPAHQRENFVSCSC